MAFGPFGVFRFRCRCGFFAAAPDTAAFAAGVRGFAMVHRLNRSLNKATLVQEWGSSFQLWMRAFGGAHVSLANRPKLFRPPFSFLWITCGQTDALLRPRGALPLRRQGPSIGVATDQNALGITKAAILACGLPAVTADAQRPKVLRRVVVRIAVRVVDVGLPLAGAQHATAMFLAPVQVSQQDGFPQRAPCPAVRW